MKIIYLIVFIIKICGEKPLDWLLLTHAPIETLEQGLEVIQSYMLRWKIEEFHKTWKSGGCRVEEIQLRQSKTVQKWAILLAAVATRVEQKEILDRL